MKFEILLPKMLPMIFIGLIFLVKVNGNKYNVLIEEKSENKDEKVFSYSGAILNNRYILTAARDNDKPETLMNATIITGYHYAANTAGTSTRLAASDRNIYQVENFWKIDQKLVLIKTKKTIHFDGDVSAVDLPTGQILKLWKNPFSLPNKQVTISKWCREDSRLTAFYLETASEVRKCPMKVCYYQNNLIPSCIQINNKKKCKLPLGSPMVCDNKLIAIRYENPVLELSEHFGPLYINVAPYKTQIDKYMLQACELPRTEL